MSPQYIHILTIIATIVSVLGMLFFAWERQRVGVVAFLLVAGIFAVALVYEQSSSSGQMKCDTNGPLRVATDPLAGLPDDHLYIAVVMQRISEHEVILIEEDQLTHEVYVRRVTRERLPPERFWKLQGKAVPFSFLAKSV